MKKRLSLLLVVFYLVTLFPITVYANDNDLPTRAEHISLACSVFPEYSHRMETSQYISRSKAGRELNDVIISQTRNVSKTHQMTYTEYSDGSFLISSVYTRAKEDFVTITDSATGGGATAFTVDLLSTPSGTSDRFVCTNVRFTIIGQDYDCITNAGNYSQSTAQVYNCSVVNEWEDPGVPAQVSYYAYFDAYSGPDYDLRIDFKVGNNSYSLTH